MIAFLLAATVALGTQCGMWDANARPVPVMTGHVVVTSFDGNGNGIVVCKGMVPAPGRHVMLNYERTGSQCGAGLQSTTDWQEDITPLGRATLTCRCVGPCY